MRTDMRCLSPSQGHPFQASSFCSVEAPSVRCRAVAHLCCMFWRLENFVRDVTTTPHDQPVSRVSIIVSITPLLPPHVSCSITGPVSTT